MIGFTDTFFTIYRNHNQLQYLTINLQPNPSSLKSEDLPHSRSLWFDSILYYVYSPEADP
jgi:hypothetical protein